MHKEGFIFTGDHKNMIFFLYFTFFFSNKMEILILWNHTMMIKPHHHHHHLYDPASQKSILFILVYNLDSDGP